MHKNTQAIQTPFSKRDAYGSLAMPVYHTAAYEFDTAAQMVDAFTGRVLEPDYSRVMNPTVTHLEDRVKAITGAANVFAFNSGMQAITNALLAVAESGRTILTSTHLFGNTRSLVTKTLARLGIRFRMVDFTRPEAVAEVIDDTVCCFFLEILTNPQLEVADLRALSTLSRKHGVPLIVDTTMVPFTEFSAAGLGVDIEVVSSTKYLSGGGTSLGGLVIDYGTFPQVNERIRFEFLFNIGGYMTPHAAYMQTLGLETLAARYRMQSATALELARRLEALPQVGRVNYPALPSHPAHELASRQFGSTGGGMLTIDLADEAACHRFLNGLRLVRRATNLFDNRTLAIHPYGTIFGNFTAEERAAMDVLPTTVRISVGLEHVDDLWEDIRQALSSL